MAEKKPVSSLSMVVALLVLALLVAGLVWFIRKRLLPGMGKLSGQLVNTAKGMSAVISDARAEFREGQATLKEGLTKEGLSEKIPAEQPKFKNMAWKVLGVAALMYFGLNLMTGSSNRAPDTKESKNSQLVAEDSIPEAFRKLSTADQETACLLFGDGATAIIAAYESGNSTAAVRAEYDQYMRPLPAAAKRYLSHMLKNVENKSRDIVGLYRKGGPDAIRTVSIAGCMGTKRIAGAVNGMNSNTNPSGSVNIDPVDTLRNAFANFNSRCMEIAGQSTFELLTQMDNYRGAGGNITVGIGSVQGQLAMLRNIGCAPRP
jgi:hypothetical protein